MNNITLCEVGMRDGLQNVQADFPTADKYALLDHLYAAGVRHVELTSFVSPKAVPMLADADDVMRYARTTYPDLHSMGLIFNARGYERARATGCDSVALVLIVSDALSEANTQRTPAAWLEKYRALIPRMKADGVRVRAYLSAAWVCPYAGATNPDTVLDYARQLRDLGVDELCPTDVVGRAHPAEVEALFRQLATIVNADQLAAHFHDTQALGLANTYAALRAGVRVFDASVGGLGGCPFAPGSAGNLATEDLVLMLEKMGYATGIDAAQLWSSVHLLEEKLQRPLGGRTRAWHESNR